MEREITEAELYKHAEAIERMIKEYAKNENRQEAITNFLKRVAEISREQILFEGQLVSSVYWLMIVLQRGLWAVVDTRGNIRVVFKSSNTNCKTVNYMSKDADVLSFLNNVADYLNQTFP